MLKHRSLTPISSLTSPLPVPTTGPIIYEVWPTKSWRIMAARAAMPPLSLPRRSLWPSRPDGCPPLPWSQTVPPASRSSLSSLSLALTPLPDTWPPSSAAGTVQLAGSPGRATPLSCPSSHPWTMARPPQSSLNDEMVLTHPCSPAPWSPCCSRPLPKP